MGCSSPCSPPQAFWVVLGCKTRGCSCWRRVAADLCLSLCPLQQQRREKELRKQQEREQRRHYEEQMRREEERRRAEHEQVTRQPGAIGLNLHASQSNKIKGPSSHKQSDFFAAITT